MGNAGFSWTEEGRGFLLSQVWRYSKGGTHYVNADYAATMLLDSGAKEGVPLPSDRATGTTWLTDRNALIQRRQPWQWALSGYTCEPSGSRWIQDRQNMVDVYNDQLGLVIGGGNTKLQPYWSTFTVGDPALLLHRPGDESPAFVPDIPLQWTADSAVLEESGDGASLALNYGDLTCRVEVLPSDDGGITLRFSAPADANAEAHIPFLNCGDTIETAIGEPIPLAEEAWIRTAKETGGHILYNRLRVTMPPGTTLRWPARQHNPYKKDGSSELDAAKLVLVLPFVETGTYEVQLQIAPTK